MDPVSPSLNSGLVVTNDWQNAGVRILLMQALGIEVRSIFW
jgi:hypothetical protein